eukprot:m.178230 g.178230  ORF g.178230 m.178230 type:complete len:50 (+) comp14923_c0_seq2:3536-3685(+)
MSHYPNRNGETRDQHTNLFDIAIATWKMGISAPFCDIFWRSFISTANTS